MPPWYLLHSFYRPTNMLCMHAMYAMYGMFALFYSALIAFKLSILYFCIYNVPTANIQPGTLSILTEPDYL